MSDRLQVEAHKAFAAIDARVSFHSGSRGRVWNEAPVGDLQASALRLAAVLRGGLSQPFVLLALENSPELVLGVLACIQTGISFAVLSPERARGILAEIGRSNALPFPTAILCDAKDRPVTTPCRVIETEEIDALVAAAESALAVAPDPSSLAYFQLTSGSSGALKAVPVTHGMLAANINAVAARTGYGSDDRTVLFIPLCHDMGLVTFLGSLMLGGSALILETASFIRNPMSWLNHVSEFRATTSAIPNFALRATQRLAKIRRVELDLSSVRRIWIGGEPVFPDNLLGFEATFAGHGLAGGAMRPSYGLAEAVVKVSTSRLSQPVTILAVARHSLVPGTEIEVLNDPWSSHNETVVKYVSNGHPLDNVALEIWGDKGSLPELRLGRIMIRGETICAAYYGRPSDLENGWRDTGDLGFLHEGEIFIVGRRKDVIIRGGINYSAEQLEQVAEVSLGDKARRIAAFSVIDHKAERERIHILCESRRDEDEIRAAVVKVLTGAIGIAPDLVLIVPPGTIPVTTSGKIRRQELRERYSDVHRIGT